MMRQMLGFALAVLVLGAALSTGCKDSSSNVPTIKDTPPKEGPKQLTPKGPGKKPAAE